MRTEIPNLWLEDTLAYNKGDNNMDKLKVELNTKAH